MKNKVIIDILERLIQETHKHNLSYKHHTDDDYIVYVEGVIEGLKYEKITDNEALKRDAEKELRE